MKPKTACTRPSRVGQVERSSSSVCRVAEKLLATLCGPGVVTRAAAPDGMQFPLNPLKVLALIGEGPSQRRLPGLPTSCATTSPNLSARELSMARSRSPLVASESPHLALVVSVRS